MKAVIYTRVSTTEQAENKQSLDQQERQCIDLATRKDVEVDRVFREEGQSAKTADRTQFQEMIRYCQENKGSVRYVIVWKVDRFARRAEDHLAVKALLLKLGIELYSATEPIENTPSGKLMETVLAGFAEFDNGVRAERSSNGMRARLMEGGWVHVAPLGYANIKDALGRPTIERTNVSKNIERLLKEFATGKYTQKQAVQLAYDLGVRSKNQRQVTANGIYKILRNPLYAGIVTGKMLKEPVVGLHEPLIAAEQHYTILAILSGRKPTLSPSSRSKPEWPLRRFLLCPECGLGVTGSTSKGRSKAYSYYHCARCKRGLRISREQAHAEFEQLLARMQPRSAHLSLFKEIVLRRWNIEHKDAMAALRAIDNEMDSLANKRQLLIDRNLDNRIDDELLREQLSRIGIRKAELIIKRGEAAEIEQNQEDIVDNAVHFMANASKIWRDAKPDDKERFQKMIYPAGIPYIGGDGFGTAELGACYQELKLIKAKKTQKAATNVAADGGKSILVDLPYPLYNRIITEVIRWNDVIRNRSKANLIHIESAV